MPNWVKNAITFEGNDKYIDKMFDWFKGDNGAIDFNKIIPCPDYIFQDDLGLDQEEYYGAENCWYEWNCRNWGTKWNACRAYSENNSIIFETAWSHPREIVNAILCKYKSFYYDSDEDWSLIVEYADEDLGSNCGTYYANNDTSFFVKTNSNDKLLLACEVWGYDYDEVLAEQE